MRATRRTCLLCAALMLLLNGCLSGPPTLAPGPATPAPPAPTAPAVLTSPAAGQVLIGTCAIGDIHLTTNRFGGAMAFVCAEGSLEQPLQVEGQGRFDVPGTFLEELGDPQPTPPAPIPARYQGQVIGSTMVLTLTLFYTAPKTYTYHLTFVSVEPTYAPPSPCA